MPTIPVSIEPEGEEYQTECSCCGRTIHWGHGWLMSGERSLAAFWYQWPESQDHAALFQLAIARFDDREHLISGVVCMSGELKDGALQYGVFEPGQAPWPDFGSNLRWVTREQALHDKRALFAAVDAITANDPRLSTRIVARMQDS